MSFVDRTDAGRQLAKALLDYRDLKPVMYALPRGGVPVAAEVAKVLGAPLEILLVRKIGVPQRPELAAGAVVDGQEPVVVRNESVVARAAVSEAEFESVLSTELAEINRRRPLYIGSRLPGDILDKVVIVVDDGVATGATMRAALCGLRKRTPRMLVAAIPVGPSDTIEMLRTYADEVVCLEDHRSFAAIGCYYADFSQVSDEEVVETVRTLSEGDGGTGAA